MIAAGYYYVSNNCLTLTSPILTLSNSIKTCRGLSYLVWAWLGGIDGLWNAKLTLGWRRTFQDIPTAEGETLGFQAAQLMDSPGRPTAANGRQIRIRDILTLHGDRQGPILLP